MRLDPLWHQTEMLKFRYTNWKSEDHDYLVTVDFMEVGPYDSSGKHGGSSLNVVLHGYVVERDGRPPPPRPGRCTFLVAKIRDIEIVGP